jgi:hypothetical protein
LITQAIFGKQYRSWSSLICSLLQFPVTFSLKDPLTFLKTLF